VPWVGVAALPERGEPRVDALVVAANNSPTPIFRDKTGCARGNPRLQNIADRYDRDADARSAGAGQALREQRSDVRQRRLSKSSTVALRKTRRGARVGCLYARNARLGALKLGGSGSLPDANCGVRGVRPQAHRRGGRQVDRGTSQHLADMAQGLGLPTGPPPATLPAIEIPPHS
jgi:hypothetical protein